MQVEAYKCQIWYRLKWLEENWNCKHLREHLNKNYQNHIKMFTDGSVSDKLDNKAGFVISDLKVQKYFQGFSIFTSALYAVLMASNYIYSVQLAMSESVCTCTNRLWIVLLNPVYCYELSSATIYHQNIKDVSHRPLSLSTLSPISIQRTTTILNHHRPIINQQRFYIDY